MATATLQDRDTRSRLGAASDDRHGWGFALLLAAVATLCLRPSDLIPALDEWPVYQFLMVCCLVVSARAAFRQLEFRQLAEQPATACVIVLLVAVVVSHLAHGFVWGARMSMYEVGKVVLFYLLVVGLVNTPRRLTQFIRWLALIITSAASLSLLDRLGIVSIAAFESIQSHDMMMDGEAVTVDRIRGTGIFQDPNDFGLILVTGLILSASFLFKPRAGWPRHLWLIPCALLLTTLALTHSRGALLSLACAFPAALAYCRGWRVGALSLLGLPLLAIAFSGRMTDTHSLVEGTGQSRIQLWSDGLSVWRQSPLFGLGEGMLVEESGTVTHNSFIHCYAELGIFGGTAFFACFLAALLGLWSLRHQGPRLSPNLPEQNRIADESNDLAHQRVFIFATLAAYSAGLLTLSRQFVVPTYLILGLATSAQSLHRPNVVQWRIGNRFIAVAVLGSVTSLAAFYIAVRLFVRW
jgi:hypothetical protein